MFICLDLLVREVQAFDTLYIIRSPETRALLVRDAHAYGQGAAVVAWCHADV